jgi:hypothetical protein
MNLLCGRPAAMSCSKPEKEPSAAEEALWQLTPTKIRAIFPHQDGQARRFLEAQCPPVPAAGPSKELMATLLDLDLWPRYTRECPAAA